LRKLFHIFLSCLSVIISCFSGADAQAEKYSEEWRWAHFTTESGLPSNQVYEVLETSDSVSWAITPAGLAWYDGFEWQPVADTSIRFQHKPDWVAPDHQGNLLAIYSGRLFRVSKNTVAQVEINAHKNQLLVEGVYVDAEEHVFLYSSLKIYQLRNGTVSELDDPVKISTFGDLIRTPLGDAWVFGLSQVYKWSGEKWIPKMNHKIEGFKVQCLCENEKGAAVASIVAPLDVRGVWECEGPGDVLKHNTQEGQALIVSASISPSGDVVALFESGEVQVRKNNTWSPLALPPSQLSHATFLRFTRRGDLWVGSETGVFFCNLSSQRWTYWKHSSPVLLNVVLGIAGAKDGSTLLATAGGLEIRHPDGTSKIVESIDGRRIAGLTGVCEDDDGNIWISSGGVFEGAYRWNGSQWKHFGREEGLDAPRIHKIKKDLEGRLWFLGLGIGNAADPGAFEYKNGKFTRWSPSEGLPNGRVYSFVETRDSALWFGTIKGMYRFKNDTWKGWVNFLPERRESTRVFTMMADNGGRVWFSGSGMLGRVDTDDRLQSFRLGDEHFTAEMMEVILDKDDRVWMSTRSPARILSYYHGNWLTLNQHNGLNNLNPWPLYAHDDKLYIGTDGSGVAILNYNEENNPPPRILLDNPSIEGKQSVFRVRAFPYWGEEPLQDVKIRYRVDDGAWSDWTTQREIRLINLSIGNHEFQAQSKSLFGRFDPAGRKIAFVIAPPFYRRPEFAVPITSLSVAVLYLGIVSVIRKRRHDRMLRDSEAKFRRLTEAAFEGIAIYDDNGIVLDANKSMLNMFGYPHSEFIGRSVNDFVGSDLREIFRGVAVPESEQPHQSVGFRKDGTTITIEIIGKMISYENRSTRVIAVRDITERKQVEEQLLAYQSKLQSLATELSLMEERERRRMATYLHDYIGQALAMCRMKLGSAGGALSVSDLDEIRKYVEQATQHTQSLTFDLSPPILYELSFEEAIEWLTEQMFHEHHLPIYFHNDKLEKPLDRNLKITMYNSIRELLINVIKHAQAASAKISLKRTGATMIAVVQDDGKGFDVAKINTHMLSNGSFGLFNVRERLSYLGGSLQIQSEPGQGTKITLVAPLQSGEKSTI